MRERGPVTKSCHLGLERFFRNKVVAKLPFEHHPFCFGRLSYNHSWSCTKAGSPNYGPQAKSGPRTHFVNNEWYICENIIGLV